MCSLVEGGGFEPPKAKPTDLQSAPFGHSGTPPYEFVMKKAPVGCHLDIWCEKQDLNLHELLLTRT